MQDFRNLDVWRRAHSVALEVYRLTEIFPRSETFGLSSQLRRAASSIPTNLAEGCGRTQAEFGKFVQIALGSACEVEYLLLLARDLGFVAQETYVEVSAKVVQVKRMLNAQLKRIQRDVIHVGAATGMRSRSPNTVSRNGLAES